MYLAERRFLPTRCAVHSVSPVPPQVPTSGWRTQPEIPILWVVGRKRDMALRVVRPATVSKPHIVSGIGQDKTLSTDRDNTKTCCPILTQTLVVQIAHPTVRAGCKAMHQQHRLTRFDAVGGEPTAPNSMNGQHIAIISSHVVHLRGVSLVLDQLLLEMEMCSRSRSN
jgi:hypothetical protein